MVLINYRLGHPFTGVTIMPGETAEFDEHLEMQIVENGIGVFTDTKGERHHDACCAPVANNAPGVSGESEKAENFNSARVDELTAENDELKASILKIQEENEDYKKRVAKLERTQNKQLKDENEVLRGANDVLYAQNADLKATLAALQGADSVEHEEEGEHTDSPLQTDVSTDENGK